MKKVLPLLLLGLLTACTVAPYKSGQQTPPAASIYFPEALPSSEAPVAQEWKSEVLVDQDFNIKAKGKEWLQAIGTKQITGHASQARLHIDLSRGNDDKGWSAIGMYVAPLAQGEGFVYPDESVYGTNLHFLSAEWRGDCKRHLAPSSSFGVLKEHSNTLTVDLSSVDMTKGNDGCEVGKDTLDLLSVLNEKGLYLGFMPSNQGYHAKVTLQYIGDLTFKPF